MLLSSYNSSVDFIIENADVKFKDFILVMKNMIFTEEEAMNVVELLKEKSNAIQEILQKVTGALRLALLLHLLTIQINTCIFFLWKTNKQTNKSGFSFFGQ